MPDMESEQQQGNCFDYRHRVPEKVYMLIVLEVKPKSNDLDLAISNGLVLHIYLNKSLNLFGLDKDRYSPTRQIQPTQEATRLICNIMRHRNSQ